jgi:hypothetical protein
VRFGTNFVHHLVTFNMSLYSSVRPKWKLIVPSSLCLFTHVKQKYLYLLIDVGTSNYNTDVEENNQKQLDR